MKWDVFISYSSADRQASRRIAADLQADGLRVWRDQDVLIPGQRFRDSIFDGISHSAAVIVLLSPTSLKSHWVLNELDAAMLREIEERRTFVIPILLGDVRSSDIPRDLRGKHYLDLRPNFRRAYQRKRSELIKSVRLAAPKITPARRRFRSLGSELMPFLCRNRHYRAKSNQTWAQLANAFLDPKDWSEDEWPNVRAWFLGQYGIEGAERLLTFVFQFKGVNFPCTETQARDSLQETAGFMMMTFVDEEARLRGDRRIEFALTKSREILWRVRPAEPRRSLTTAYARLPRGSRNSS
jgi:hypothetical protein